MHDGWFITANIYREAFERCIDTYRIAWFLGAHTAYEEQRANLMNTCQIYILPFNIARITHGHTG